MLNRIESEMNIKSLCCPAKTMNLKQRFATFWAMKPISTSKPKQTQH